MTRENGWEHVGLIFDLMRYVIPNRWLLQGIVECHSTLKKIIKSAVGRWQLLMSNPSRGWRTKNSDRLHSARREDDETQRSSMPSVRRISLDATSSLSESFSAMVWVVPQATWQISMFPSFELLELCGEAAFIWELIVQPTMHATNTVDGLREESHIDSWITWTARMLERSIRQIFVSLVYWFIRVIDRVDLLLFLA